VELAGNREQKQCIEEILRVADVIPILNQNNFKVAKLIIHKRKSSTEFNSSLCQGSFLCGHSPDGRQRGLDCQEPAGSQTCGQHDHVDVPVILPRANVLVPFFEPEFLDIASKGRVF